MTRQRKTATMTSTPTSTPISPPTSPQTATMTPGVPDLLKKYNQPGPRYTSYPTVPYWDQTPTQDQWIAHLDQELTASQSRGHGAAIYLHIPFCEQLCTFCGCNTHITKKYDRVAPYMAAVGQEWETYRQRLGREQFDVSEMHLGGGTPTYLTPDDLKTYLSPLISHMRRLDGSELSFEADPRVTSRQHLQALKDLGFTRLSLGIQDFDPQVQTAINRVQSAQSVARLCDAARDIGYTSINFDLIYGLPFQTPAALTQTFEQVLKMRPDRIAFYGYAHIPWIKPGQRSYGEADLPDGQGKHALYALGREMLTHGGYHDVGLDHFALPHDGLWRAVTHQTLFRNFMGYMPRQVSPMIGLGVSAIGDAWTAFGQNEKDLKAYQSRAMAGEIPLSRGHILTQEDQILRRHILNLMTTGTTHWDQAETFTDYLLTVPERAKAMADDGILTLEDHGLSIHPDSRAFMRNVAMLFDARLSRKAPSKPTFSKTV